ncbi:MAG: hypothetical protein QM770_21115 [Tepidisphaeraceae bacterium]
MLNPCDPAYVRDWIARTPVGTVGVWDNQQAQVWHGVTIDELLARGFVVLHECTLDDNPLARFFLRWQREKRVRFVVVKRVHAS